MCGCVLRQHSVAHESVQCARVAKMKITSMQHGVAQSFSDTAAQDPLGEPKALEEFRNFFMNKGLPKDYRSWTIRLLASRKFVYVKRVPNNLVSEDVQKALRVELDTEELVEAVYCSVPFRISDPTFQKL